jgi:protein SCO1/2
MPLPRTGKSLGLSRKTFAILGACVLIAAAGVVWAVRPQAPPPSLIGGPFQLQDANGKTVTEADFRGEPFLVYFGYTHCPDVCPATLAQISDVMKRLPDKPIKALFITVDPERDTPKLMADYVSSFDPRIIGLSGTPQEIAAAEKVYRVYARKAPGKDGDYGMDHSSIIYLMDAKGAFVEAFNLERTPDEAAAELKTYF